MPSAEHEDRVRLGRASALRSLPPAALIVLALLLSLAFSVSAGSVSIPLEVVWKVAVNQLWPGSFEETWSQARSRIVWDLRFPRALFAAIVGAGLAVVGAALQAATRNPLADPYLFGLSAGAALGAVTVIVHTGDFLGAYSLPLMAFVGAFLSMLLVLGIYSRKGPSGPERLILAGVAVSFVLMAATNFLIFLGDQRAAHSVVFWMLGGLGLARWSQIWLPAVVVAAGSAWLMVRAQSLNAMMMGDETAASLGVEVGRARLAVFAVAALVTAVLVALAGAIGFVGLVIPHILRRLIGGDNRRLLFLCALVGALFLVWVDLLARVVMAPQELPIGIITAGVGGLYFAWMLRRR